MRVRSPFVLLAALSLAACSGGGGGDGGGGGFTMSSQSASFTAVEQGALPAGQTITISVTGSKVAYVGAAYRQGETKPPWLGVAMHLVPNSTTVLLDLSILSTVLAPTTYTSTFMVGTGDQNGNVLETKDVTVTYVVTARPAAALTARQAEVALGDAGGRSTAPVTFPFWLDSDPIASCAYPASASP